MGAPSTVSVTTLSSKRGLVTVPSSAMVAVSDDVTEYPEKSRSVTTKS